MVIFNFGEQFFRFYFDITISILKPSQHISLVQPINVHFLQTRDNFLPNITETIPSHQK